MITEALCVNVLQILTIKSIRVSNSVYYLLFLSFLQEGLLCHRKWFKSTLFFTHALYIYIYIIIIIILLCHQHQYPWPSLATPPYRSSLLAGSQGYISILIELLFEGSSWSPCFARSCEGVHRRTSLMSLCLLL